MPAAKRKAADDEHERFDLGSGGSRSASPEPAPSKPSTSSSARQQHQPPVKRAKTTTTGGASGSRTNGKARETPIAVTDVEEEPAPTIQPLRRPTADVREIERVRKLLKDRDEQLDAALAQRDTLQKQNDQLHAARTTSAEQSRDDQLAQYEARLRALQKLNDELTKQLKIAERGVRASKNITPHFITREAALEERKALEKRLQEAEDALKERDTSITELQETLRIAEGELKMEKANAQSLAARHTPGLQSTPHHQFKSSKSAPDAAKDELIRLYEDITNLLITNVKTGIDTSYRCVYSPSLQPDQSPNGGISFDFTLTKMPADPTSPGQSGFEQIMYMPGSSLNNEPGLADRLEYFGREFKFPVFQLAGFFKQLVSHLSGDHEEEEED